MISPRSLRPAFLGLALLLPPACCPGGDICIENGLAPKAPLDTQTDCSGAERPAWQDDDAGDLHLYYPVADAGDPLDEDAGPSPSMDGGVP